MREDSQGALDMLAKDGGEEPQVTGGKTRGKRKGKRGVKRTKKRGHGRY